MSNQLEYSYLNVIIDEENRARIVYRDSYDNIMGLVCVMPDEKDHPGSTDTAYKIAGVMNAHHFDNNARNRKNKDADKKKLYVWDRFMELVTEYYCKHKKNPKYVIVSLKRFCELTRTSEFVDHSSRHHDGRMYLAGLELLRGDVDDIVIA